MEISATCRRGLHALVPRPPSSGIGAVSPRAEPISDSEPLPGSLPAYSRDFINQIKAEFPEDSREWLNIEHTLREFWLGRQSKRETHRNMAQFLGTHDELQQGLAGLLGHSEARWAVGDFDLSVNIYHAALQPVSNTQHLPQMTMPMSGWHHTESSYQPQPTTLAESPTLFPPQETFVPRGFPTSEQDTRMSLQNTAVGYNGLGHGGSEKHRNSSIYANPIQEPASTHDNWSIYTQNGQSSPAIPPPMSNEFPFYQPCASPSSDRGYTGNYGAPEHIASTQQAHDDKSTPQWKEMGWEAAGPQDPQALFQMPGDGQHHSPPDSTAASQGVSPFKRHSFPMPPPTNHDSRIGAHGLGENQLHGAMDQHRASEAPSYCVTDDLGDGSDGNISEVESKPPKLATRTRKSRAKHESERTAPRTFVHAICGKAFAERIAVKKHHWGRIQGDKNTKTGCWAKSGKPDHAWDEHPSCHRPEVQNQSDQKPELNARKSVKPKMPSEREVSSTDSHTAGFPDLSELPGKVAEIVYPTIPMNQGIAYDNLLRGLSRDGPGMDSLLTAVNAVSQLDHPKPKEGRNNSLALHLDAQVLASEQIQRQEPNPHMAMPWGRGSRLRQELVEAASDQHYYNTLESPFVIHNRQSLPPVPGNGYGQERRYPADQQLPTRMYPGSQQFAGTQGLGIQMESRGPGSLPGYNNLFVEAQKQELHSPTDALPPASLFSRNHTQLDDTIPFHGEKEKLPSKTTKRSSGRIRSSVAKKRGEADNNTPAPVRKRAKKE